jgi:hypothetical protein
VYRHDGFQQLIDAIDSAISRDPDVIAALHALEISGMELRSLHIKARLRTVEIPVPEDDARFLRAFRIVPNLEIQK